MHQLLVVHWCLKFMSPYLIVLCACVDQCFDLELDIFDFHNVDPNNSYFLWNIIFCVPQKKVSFGRIWTNIHLSVWTVALNVIFWIFIVCSIVTVPLLCVCSCCWDRVCWWPLSWAELRSNGWLLTERWWGDYLLTPSVMVSKRTLARYPSSLFSFSPLLVSSPLFAVSLTAHFPSMGLGGMHTHRSRTPVPSVSSFSVAPKGSWKGTDTSTHTHTHTHMYMSRFLLNLRGIWHTSLSYFCFVKLDTIPNLLIIFSYHVLFRAYMANALCARSLDTWQTSLALFLSLTLSAHPFPFPSSPP